MDLVLNLVSWLGFLSLGGFMVVFASRDLFHGFCLHKHWVWWFLFVGVGWCELVVWLLLDGVLVSLLCGFGWIVLLVFGGDVMVR
jgi:hypothetical protein